MSRFIRTFSALAAAAVATLVASSAFACNYDTQVSVGAIPICFDVVPGCGELILESSCDAIVTFEEVDCATCAPTQTVPAGTVVNVPLRLPAEVEGSTLAQSFRWESQGTQAFIDVTTTYTTAGDVACEASTVHRPSPAAGGAFFLVLLGVGLLLRRRD